MHIQTKSGEKLVKDELALEDSVTYLIFRINNVLNHNFRSDLGPVKVSNQEWSVLSSLKSRGGRSTISELAACTTIKQPVISRIVTEMQENGLVQKNQNAKDRRITQVKLMSKGNKLFKAILPTAERHRDIALTGVSATELGQARRILKKIQANLGIKPATERLPGIAK
ncbi:MAG: MarR family winged helix-turn-helix transcriptional regulator [Gammaproteobacteria bacterium]|nr:MarR family winged helix-turn-helix transcriptional regulator [Gammaproteobacteria bacterium]MCY4210470.1 MarR family winged helix-turn-helix transcriptional regulator [Gammaproteobacteria bacterium]MCY4282166.1 MarR family winged helix-turn-helix transcriptional regulator [Gammaproteobacteria bacterium]MCY4339376.1 MarR family winged helix-turn-helix transcriptional regulator [Gammaproteobacteria bacterium]